MQKLKVLGNGSSSKKVAIIVPKYSDVVWSNDGARIDRISIVEKALSTKKKVLEEKARLDSNSQVDSRDPLSAAKNRRKWIRRRCRF